MGTDLATPGVAWTGAAESGIVWVYRFAPNGAAESVSANAIADGLAQGAGWWWVHTALADARCRIWLERSAPMSATAREVLLGPDEHLRLDVVQDEVIGVLPDFQRDLAQASDTFARWRFVMTNRLLITARRHPLHSIELARRSTENGVRFATPAALLDGLLDHFADSIGRLTEDLGHELNVVEERVLHDDAGDERQRIARSRLQVVRVRRQLAQMKSLFHRMEQRLGHDNTVLAATFRTLSQKLDALDHDVGDLQERSRLLQDEMAAKMTAITNRRLLTLSMLTACLLPPTLVTGFFGMNTKDLPFQQTDVGTWYAFAVAAAAGALTFWALQRLRAL
jgi:zinc transporter